MSSSSNLSSTSSSGIDWSSESETLIWSSSYNLVCGSRTDASLSLLWYGSSGVSIIDPILSLSNPEWGVLSWLLGDFSPPWILV